MRDLKYYIPGSLLIVIAIVIVAVPEILLALIAASIIMAGIGALYIGHMVRKSEIELMNFDGWFFDNRPYGRRFLMEPIFIRRYRRY